MGAWVVGTTPGSVTASVSECEQDPLSVTLLLGTFVLFLPLASRLKQLKTPTNP